MVYNLTNTLPAYTKVADVTVSVATTSVTIDGLNITKDDDYLLVSDINNTAGDSAIYFYVNGNVTPSNYYRQLISADSTSTTASRDNYPYLTGAWVNTKSLSVSKLKLTNNGYVVLQSSVNWKYGGSATALAQSYTTSTFTAISITSITLTASSGLTALGVGSRFQLYKCTATKVADITVTGSDVNSVSLSGFTIGKSSEYMLVSDIVNPTVYASDYAIYSVPSATTYSQRLNAITNSVSAIRDASGAFITNITGYSHKHFTITNIKLTNSGFFVCQSNSFGAYTNAVNQTQITNAHITRSTAVSSVSQISIVAENAGSGAIGIGSRFQLYKLR